MSTKPGIRAFIGIPGAGKTTLLRQQVHEAAREFPVFVLDLAEDWNEVPRSIGWRPARSWSQAKSALDGGARLVICRPPHDKIEETAVAAANWALSTPGPKGIAIPEGHNVFPNVQGGPAPLQLLLTKWRHIDLTLWVDTQRIVLLSTTLRGCARELRIFAQCERADLDEVRRIGDDELVSQVQEAARRMDDRDRGGDEDPGWHVVLGLVRRPPFELVQAPLARAAA